MSKKTSRGNVSKLTQVKNNKELRRALSGGNCDYFAPCMAGNVRYNKCCFTYAKNHPNYKKTSKPKTPPILPQQPSSSRQSTQEEHSGKTPGTIIASPRSSVSTGSMLQQHRPPLPPGPPPSSSPLEDEGEISYSTAKRFCEYKGFFERTANLNGGNISKQVRSQYKAYLEKKDVKKLYKMAIRMGISITKKRDGKTSYIKKETVVKKICDAQYPSKSNKNITN